MGSTLKDSINGVIFLPKEQKIELRGSLKNDSLYLQFISNQESTFHRTTILPRVSTSTKYNMNKIFGTQKSRTNNLLVGEWHFIKKLNNEGVQIHEDFSSYVFYSDGYFVLRSSAPEVTALKRKFGVKTEPKSKWETSGSTLLLSFGDNRTALPSFVLENTFELRGDTLILIGGRKRYKSFYLRSKK
jgi:hypothetical protein